MSDLFNVVVFDIHGVLADVDRSGAFASIFHRKVHELLKSKCALHDEVVEQILHSIPHKYGTASLMLKQLGLYKDYINLFYEVPLSGSPNPRLARLIQQLKRAGATLLCATNSPPDFAEAQLKHVGIDPSVFDEIVCPPRFQPRPNAQQLKYVCDKYGFEKALFIGDRILSDVLLARVHGLLGLQVHNSQETVQVLQVLLQYFKLKQRGLIAPDYTVQATPLKKAHLKLYELLIRAGVVPSLQMLAHIGVNTSIEGVQDLFVQAITGDKQALEKLASLHDGGSAPHILHFVKRLWGRTAVLIFRTPVAKDIGDIMKLPGVTISDVISIFKGEVNAKVAVFNNTTIGLVLRSRDRVACYVAPQYEHIGLESALMSRVL